LPQLIAAAIAGYRIGTSVLDGARFNSIRQQCWRVASLPAVSKRRMLTSRARAPGRTASN